MNATARLLAQARRQHDAGALDEACDSCRQILAVDPQNGLALELLGVVAGRRQDTATAVQMLEAALAQRPRDAGLLANLGAVYRAAGRIGDAEESYRKALTIEPTAVPARFNFANLLSARGALEDALREYALVLERESSHAGALNNMAALLKAKGFFTEAETVYRRLIETCPRDAGARSNLGALLMDLGRTESAITLYREAIALDPAAPEPRNNLGVALLDAGVYDEAIECLGAARALDSGVASVHENLGNALRKIGATEEAARSYEDALALSDAGGVRFKLATLLPVIAESTAEMDDWRDRMASSVASLARNAPSLSDPNAEVGVTAFNLSYQDTNNRDLQAALARAYGLSSPSLSYVAPHCAGARRGRGPLKIGFISRHFGTHAVGWCFHGVLRHMPQRLATVTVLRIGSSDDPLWGAIVSDVDAVVTLPASLPVARERIAALELDVLVYTDIGMESLTYFLAFARLAPLQCVLGGHPDTTGIPNLDLYVSSDLQEPSDAETHYSERLIRLPGAPTYYDRPALPSPLKPRSFFGLPDGVGLYFCAQTLIKIHPEMDVLFAGILARDPDGIVLLPSGYIPQLADRLRSRFAETLGALSKRVIFLPTLSHQNFMNVMALADVSLDTRPFGGGNTSWQAIAAGTPIVSWPGRYLRGRYTQALYRLMGVEDTIADSADAYIDMAVRLGRDAAFRGDVQARIEARAGLIFSDMTHVEALHDTLVRFARG